MLTPVACRRRLSRALRLVLLIAVAAFLASCHGSQAASPSAPTMIRSNAERSQAALDAIVFPGDPGCSAAVGVEGVAVWKGVRGVADLETGAEITPGTLFDVASISDEFIAAAIVPAERHGKLSVNDHVSDHVAGLPAWGADVTVADLLRHSSGIPDVTSPSTSDAPRKARTGADPIQRPTAVHELRFTPGTRVQYSAADALLLGEVTKSVSGETLPTFVHARIFAPLHLDMQMGPTTRG